MTRCGSSGSKSGSVSKLKWFRIYIMWLLWLQCSSASGCSRSSGSAKDDKWTFKLWFDSEADKTTERKFKRLTVDKLSTEVQGPAIKNVSVYKTLSWQDSQRPTGDLFLVLEDELGQYWSIDKSNEGLTIQKGKNLDDVINVCKWQKRTSKRVKEIMPEAKTNVSDVIHWIQDKVVPQLQKELQKELKPGESYPDCYDFIESVCRHFKTHPLDGIPKPDDNSCCSGWKDEDESGKYLFYYIPEVEVNYKSWITADELVHKVGDDYFDAYEPIISATTYRTPLGIIQCAYNIFCHEYVVLETRSWWWSIEKNSEGLTVQRSKELSAVRNRYRQEARKSTWLNKGVKVVKSAKGTKTVRELITWLEKEKWLDRKYNLVSSNCKDFADAVYIYVT